MRCVAVVALGVFVFAVSAFAKEPPPPKPARLIYVRSDGASVCPDEGYLHKAVASHFEGRDPFASEAREHITVTVQPVRGGFTAVATLYDANGTPVDDRDHTASTCEQVLDFMGLSLSILWPSLFSGEVPRSSPPAPPAAPPAAPFSKASPPPLPPRRPHVVGELGPAMSFAMLPGPSLGFTGAIGVRWPVLSLGLEGLADFPASTTAQPAAGGSMSLSLLYASFVPCLHTGWLLGCGLLSGGKLTKVDTLPYRGSSFYGAAGARVGLEVPLAPHFAVGTTGDIVIPFFPDSEVKGWTTVWTMPPLGFALGTRLVASF